MASPGEARSLAAEPPGEAKTGPAGGEASRGGVPSRHEEGGGTSGLPRAPGKGEEETGHVPDSVRDTVELQRLPAKNTVKKEEESPTTGDVPSHPEDGGGTSCLPGPLGRGEEEAGRVRDQAERQWLSGQNTAKYRSYPCYLHIIDRIAGK